MKFRKKPVVIEAVQYTRETVNEVHQFIHGDNATPITGSDDGITLLPYLIKTLEGEMMAQEGDYIIKGVQGEFYPCKPDIFEQTYECVE